MTDHPVDPATLRIVLYPDPVLRQKASPIETVTDEVRAVADRMIELMNEAEGVGLAGPQVGLSWRIFVTRGYDPADDEQEPGEDRVYINPRLTLERGEMVAQEEGCLSLPGIHGDVRRPTTATITALDRDGHEFTMTSDQFLGRIWQHEYDHLDGRLIFDRMNPIDKLSIRKAVRALEAEAAAGGR